MTGQQRLSTQHLLSLTRALPPVREGAFNCQPTSAVVEMVQTQQSLAEFGMEPHAIEAHSSSSELPESLLSMR